MEVIDTSCSCRRFAARLNPDRSQAGKRGDDGDDDQHFDQRYAAAKLNPVRLRPSSVFVSVQS